MYALSRNILNGITEQNIVEPCFGQSSFWCNIYNCHISIVPNCVQLSINIWFCYNLYCIKITTTKNYNLIFQATVLYQKILFFCKTWYIVFCLNACSFCIFAPSGQERSYLLLLQLKHYYLVQKMMEDPVYKWRLGDI